ncbi:uncharacterized protein LOC106088903 [Stomoxys calcitrans]|uniref:Uncharacterized protein n=1 Tax=Stomoxys calcitrans TaxID=35570 RepID=A0A1I8P406_STOCA|nr:uncharacterized protein LOC106088903 [Stomoxys calcitrans]
MAKSKFLRVTSIVTILAAFGSAVVRIAADGCIHTFHVIHEHLPADSNHQINSKNAENSPVHSHSITHEDVYRENLQNNVLQAIQIIRQHPTEFIKTVQYVNTNDQIANDESYPSYTDAIETLKSLKAYGAFSDERRLLNSYGQPIAGSWQIF